jgi:chemotaxis protein CheX
VDFAKIISETTDEIFNCMIFIDVAAQPPLESGKQAIGCHVSAMIGLTGGISAMLGIHCPSAVGLAVAGAMLGMELEKIDVDVKDALGEMANMMAGGIKERLSLENINLELAIPTAVAGQSYVISAPNGSKRVVVPFTISQGQFFVEIKYQLN